MLMQKSVIALSMALLFVAVQGYELPASTSSSKYCPDNCVPMLGEVCDTVVGMLEKVPVFEKKVPFALEIVGRSICFPEDKKNVPNSLCPSSECGKTSETSEIFAKVCNYVDDILQATPGVSTKVRNLTDHAICGVGNLIPDSEVVALTQTQKLSKSKSKSKDSHCPKNCVEKASEICDQVESILENVPVVGENSMILDIVGKGICFPAKAEPEPNTLCPKSCGNDDNKEMFTKVCNYVDNILQSIPTVSKSVRNMTDHAICVIGTLIPDDFDEELDLPVVAQSQSENKMCPENCEDKLKEICEFVEDLVGSFPQVSELGAKEIGRAICFPKSADKHPDSKCLDDCGDEETEKICEYVDLLMQVPQIPEQAREVTTKVICKLGGLFDKKIKAALAHQASGIIMA